LSQNQMQIQNVSFVCLLLERGTLNDWVQTSINF